MEQIPLRILFLICGIIVTALLDTWDGSDRLGIFLRTFVLLSLTSSLFLTSLLIWYRYFDSETREPNENHFKGAPDDQGGYINPTLQEPEVDEVIKVIQKESTTSSFLFASF